MELIINKINLLWGVLAAIFGEFWYLFFWFLVLNVIDYITGVWKVKHTNTENSSRELLKK